MSFYLFFLWVLNEKVRGDYFEVVLKSSGKMSECLRMSPREKSNYLEFYDEKVELFRVFGKYLELRSESN